MKIGTNIPASIAANSLAKNERAMAQSMQRLSTGLRINSAADDAAGLIMLAVFYPQGYLAPTWLMLSVGAAVAVYLLFNVLPRPWDTGTLLRPA